jgi:hypothetical protein
MLSAPEQIGHADPAVRTILDLEVTAMTCSHIRSLSVQTSHDGQVRYNAGVVIARLWLVPLLAPVSMQLASAATGPGFGEYPARQVFTGKPAKARIVTSQQRYWAEWIVSGKPNFAGHYRVVDWPCGTECMGLAIIDVKTGTVHAPPLNSDKWPFALPIASTDFQYPEYRLDSTLFIVRNACPEGLDKTCWNFLTFSGVAFAGSLLRTQMIPVMLEVTMNSSAPLNVTVVWASSDGSPSNRNRYLTKFPICTRRIELRKFDSRTNHVQEKKVA